MSYFKTTQEPFTYRHIHSFADAERAYDSITPIRGTQERRLGTRKDRTRSIVKSGNDYVLRAWANNVLTYCASGEIIVHPSYTDFLQHYLPPPFSVVEQDGKYYLQTEHEGFRHYRLDKALTFSQENGVWVTDAPETHFLPPEKKKRVSVKIVREKMVEIVPAVKALYPMVHPDDLQSIYVSRNTGAGSLGKHLIERGIQDGQLVPIGIAQGLREILASCEKRLANVAKYNTGGFQSWHIKSLVKDYEHSDDWMDAYIRMVVLRYVKTYEN